jgi:hypothetical protein
VVAIPRPRQPYDQVYVEGVSVPIQIPTVMLIETHLDFKVRNDQNGAAYVGRIDGKVKQ